MEKNKVEDWEPKKNDMYYYWDSMYVVRSFFTGNGYSKMMLCMGNCFQTEREAEDYGKRLQDHYKVKKRIKELNGDWVPNFYEGDFKYSFYKQHMKIHIQGDRRLQYYPTYKYIKSPSIAGQIRNEFTEEELTNFILTSL